MQTSKKLADAFTLVMRCAGCRQFCSSTTARQMLLARNHQPPRVTSISCLKIRQYSAGKTDTKIFFAGPLETSRKTKEAMLRDAGSRDKDFIEMARHIRQELLVLAEAPPSGYTVVPMQGSGTFSIEAFFSTAVPRQNGRVLILESGPYGKRQKKVCDVLNIPHQCESFPENSKVDLRRVEEILQNDKSFTTVGAVHCETSSGVINPIADIGKIVKHYMPDAVYFVDAMSSFGAIPLNIPDCHIDYMVSSANKCIEGVPGFAFIIANKEHLLSCKGQARSYSLDLVDQYEALESNGQFRFTPPTHAMYAFKQALEELKTEGGITARAARYRGNRRVLLEGMKALGFKEYLDNSHDGYIVTSYYFPQDKNFHFEEFCSRLSNKGMFIHPAKGLQDDYFRIGTIGQLFPNDFRRLVIAIEEVCHEMDIKIPLQ